MSVRVMGVIIFLFLVCNDCFAASLPSQLYSVTPFVLSTVLAPDYKGGMIIGEIIGIENLSKDESYVYGKIQMKVIEVIGGSIQAQSVQIAYSRRISGYRVLYPVLWDYIRPRIGLQLVVALTGKKTAGGVYETISAFPVEPSGDDCLPAYRTIAKMLKIRNPHDRLMALNEIDLKAQPLTVQMFALEQVEKYSEPSVALKHLTTIFHRMDSDPIIRWNAAGMISSLVGKLEQKEQTLAIDVLIGGLADPDEQIRDISLQLLMYKAASENPYNGSISVNPKIINAIEQMIRTEKSAVVRRRALEVQKYIRVTISKIQISLLNENTKAARD